MSPYALMLTLLLALCAGCAGSAGQGEDAGASGQAGTALVPVEGPGIRVRMRYFTRDNLVGVPLDGYLANRCLLAPVAADALRQVAADLAG